MRTLRELLSVIAFADKHQVKNVKFHLGMKTAIGYDLQYKTYNKLKAWALEQGLNVAGAFHRGKYPNSLDGIAIRTEQRNCLVFVYFD